MSALQLETAPRGGWARFGRQVGDWVPAAVVFVLGIGIWEGYVRGFDVGSFLLPAPTAILDTLLGDFRFFSDAGLFTFKEALGGFALGSGAGVLAALVFARWRPLGRAIMPYAIAANAVPIIAFAPITNNWFGVLNPFSKMAIAAVLCFFPVMVNTLRGLTSVRPAQIELMRSYAASEREIFRRVRIPNALPYLFAALKVATVLAMIGAIVGDYFGGSPNALGIQIRRFVGISAFEEAWAAITVASALGIVFYAAVALAERVTTRWQPLQQGGE